jgi:hypothetical protein
MAIDIRRRMSGENRRGDLRGLVRSRSRSRRESVPPFAPAAFFDIERYVKLIGALPNETGLENKTWNTSTVSGLQTAGPFVLHAMWNPAGSFTIDPATGIKVYSQRMNGVRFAIDGYSDVFRQSLQTHFTTANIPVTGRSSLLPVNESHLVGDFQSVLIPHMGFNHFWYNYGGPSWTDVETTHYRVWIGGVDRTGIVALASPFAHTFAGGRLGLPGEQLFHRRIGGYLTASIPSGSYKSQTVWFDIWVTVKTYNSAAYIGGNQSSPGSYEPVCQVDSNALFNRAVFRRANVNAKRYVGDAYRFTFPDNEPGGQSTLSATTGSGWTATSTNAGLSINNATHGIVSLNWSTESPVLTCTLNSKLNSPAGAGASMRYLPTSPGTYGHRNQNGSSVSYGVWNPQGSTTFQQVARQVGSVFVVKGSANAPASLFTGFPSTITVEKI